MSEKEIKKESIRVLATVTDCVQVGIDEFRDVNRSKEFGPDDRFSDVLAWAKSISENNNFSLIKFSTIED
jgi:hypothetical protein